MHRINQVLEKLKIINNMDEESIIRNYLINNHDFNESNLCHDTQLSGRRIDRDRLMSIASEVFAEGYEFFYDKNIQKISFDLIVNRIVASSNKRSWEIYKAYVIDQNITLQELANSYNLTRERIRQIIKKIKERELNSFYVREIMRIVYKHLKKSSLSKHFFAESMFRNDEFVFYGDTENQIFESLSLMANMVNKKLYYISGYYVILDEKYKSLDDFFKEKVFNNFKQGQINNLEYIYRNLFFDEVPISCLKKWMHNDKNTILHKSKLYFKFDKLTKVDRCKFILLILNEPSHYTDVYKLYSNIFNDGTTEHAVHALMDRGRNEGIVRTFIGTFGLEELGEKQHITIQDIATSIMNKEKKEYDMFELVKEISRETDAKENSILTTILTNKIFLVTKESTVILRTWKQNFKVEETRGKNTFNEQGKILNYDYLKYTINEFTIKYNRIRIPYDFIENLKPYVSCVYNDDEVLLKYDSKSRLLVGIDKFIHDMNLCEGSSFYMVFRNHKFYIVSELNEFETDEKIELDNSGSKEHVSSILDNLFGRA